jgi:hypothetical protein
MGFFDLIDHPPKPNWGGGVLYDRYNLFNFLN